MRERTASNSSLDVTKNAPLSAKDSRKNEEFLEEVSGGRRVILTKKKMRKKKAFLVWHQNLCHSISSSSLVLYMMLCMCLPMEYFSFLVTASTDHVDDQSQSKKWVVAQIPLSPPSSFFSSVSCYNTFSPAIDFEGFQSDNSFSL